MITSTIIQTPAVIIREEITPEEITPEETTHLLFVPHAEVPVKETNVSVVTEPAKLFPTMISTTDLYTEHVTDVTAEDTSNVLTAAVTVIDKSY